jgi:maltose O-acetyltransferase
VQQTTRPRPHNEEINVAGYRFREYVADVVRHGAVPGRIRMAALRAVGVEVGQGAQIAPGVRLRGAGRFALGAGSGINTDVLIDCNADVVLGRNVKIGPNCALITSDHSFGPPEDRCGPPKARPIVIEDGVWLAVGVTVLPGVTIGAGSFLAPNTVVRVSVPPNTMWAAPSARKIKDLPA